MTRSEETVAAILAAAECLFLDTSYADVTMDRIAGKSGVTKGALYHHFPSKEALYLQMMHAALGRMRDVFREAIAAGTGCRERLGNLTRSFFEQPPDRIALMRLVRRDVNVFPPSQRAKLVRAYQAALPALVETVIQDGLRAGELAPADPRLLAWHFIAMVEVTLGRHADSVFRGAGTKLDYVLDLFFRGAAGRRSGTAGHRRAAREVAS